ncbi:Kinase D-interacting substrate of 220 kDa [Geodia barretti]|uniref:Kinase D-interacting substrate of 220 kDa n=1 Tax=Geodia barretti TaxID=519541 RepID=A0AA35T5K8_GEOBA|nr:Kinase D-interacting substrate of 220 kDa [Geodia barretti]
MRAAWEGKTDVVVELVKGGANLDLQNKDGDSAVIRAVVGYEPATLRELVRAGSDLNLQNQEGLTPLMIAVRSGRTDITNILLEGEHINVDIQENYTIYRNKGCQLSAYKRRLLRSRLRKERKGGLIALGKRDLSITMRESPQTVAISAPPTQQDSSTVDQDTPLTQQDSSTVDQDTPPTQQDIIDTTQITSHQRRGRRNISQALRNLVKRSGQIAVQIFNDLDRRLKSADKKDQPGLRAEGRGQGSEGKQKMDNRKSRSENRKPSTTTSTVK